MNQENKMKHARSHFMRFAAALALGAASIAAATPAFAQSAEYRRGYDDGYEAGQRAAGSGQGQGRNGGYERIRIDQAEYGRRGAMCDARRSVIDSIERNNGVVVVDNRLCGDPIRSVEKRLRVTYRCGDSEPVRVVGQEGERLRLSCRR
jgi:hypothetical protein